MSKQPVWKEVSKTDYSAVYVDATGAYSAEMEIGQDMEDDVNHDDGGTVAVYRFSLEQLVQRNVDGATILVSQYIDTQDRLGALPHPLKSYDEWFTANLGKIADCVGLTIGDLTDMLCSDDVGARAQGYEAIGSYHGYDNLDSYPHFMTHNQWTER